MALSSLLGFSLRVISKVDISTFLVCMVYGIWYINILPHLKTEGANNQRHVNI